MSNGGGYMSQQQAVEARERAHLLPQEHISAEQQGTRTNNKHRATSEKQLKRCVCAFSFVRVCSLT